MNTEKRCHKALTEMPDADPELIDEEFFAGLCNREILLLCQGVKLSPLNILLIGLHCKGCSDKAIEENLTRFLPFFSSKKHLSAGAIKERRHYAVRLMTRKYGRDIGLISAMHTAFKH